MEPIVRRVDHVVVFAGDAPALFHRLAAEWQWPVVWPLLDFGGYVSGGVSLGNLNVEVTPAREPGAAALRGLVFAADAAGLAELDRRGRPHSPPGDYAGDALRGTPDFDPATPPGTRLWTALGVSGLPGPGYVALCDYNYAALKPMAHYADALRGRGGGPLGVTGAREIVIGVTDPAAAVEPWQTLLAPAAPAQPGQWALGAGPDLRFVPAENDGIQSVVIVVASLERAERYLRQADLLGAADADGLTLAPEAAPGLTLRFVA